MVFATLKLHPPVRERGELLDVLRSVRDQTQLCPGCCGSWLDDGGYLRGPIIYVEHWESEEALRQHLASDLYGKLLVAMELSSQVPEVLFCFVGEIKGMELIEETRGRLRNRLANRN